MIKLKPDELNAESLKGLTLKGRLLSERVFLLKDTGIDSKIFHVWKNKGLVDFIEKGEWARFTFIEYLWLRTLETMRRFGCSVKLMKLIYDDLFTKAFKENLAAKTLKTNYDHFKKLSKIRTLTSEESEIFDLCEYYIQNPILNVGIRNEISYFYQLVLDTLKYKAETGLIIFEDQTFSKFMSFSLESKKQDETIINISRPHLYIPISSFILQFIEDKEKDEFLIKTGLLNEDEYRVIREIRNKNIKCITITFNEKHKVEKIECDRKGLIKGDEAKKIMNLLGLKNYAGIEINTRDGKTLSFTHTEKKFF